MCRVAAPFDCCGAVPASAFLGVWTSLIAVGTQRVVSRSQFSARSLMYRMKTLATTCAVIPKSMQSNTSTQKHDSSKPMTTLYSGCTGLRCARRSATGAVCVRVVARQPSALSPTAVQGTTECVRRTAHAARTASCVPERESEDTAHELPVATDLDQASTPPLSHMAPSHDNSLPLQSGAGRMTESVSFIDQPNSSHKLRITMKSHPRPKPLFEAVPSKK